jgi:hypothetical protein
MDRRRLIEQVDRLTVLARRVRDLPETREPPTPAVSIVTGQRRGEEPLCLLDLAEPQRELGIQQRNRPR